MTIDFCCAIGPWAFRRLESTTAWDCRRELKREGIDRAVVSSLPAVTYKNPHEGNFALMVSEADDGSDLPSVIRHFGRQNRVFFVHFRDVRGRPRRFVETFHDDGQTDMLACLKAYRDIGYEGVCRPDHVPTMEGDSNDRPGYSSVGRLFAIGYMKGLREAVYAG